jgi:hypothetical protein
MPRSVHIDKTCPETSNINAIIQIMHLGDMHKVRGHVVGNDTKHRKTQVITFSVLLKTLPVYTPPYGVAKIINSLPGNMWWHWHYTPPQR